jgi:hypothetical protein
MEAHPARWHKRGPDEGGQGMRDFLDQIETAVRANLYYIALFASLAVPSICGAIQSEDGEDTREKYVQWFNEHVADRYLGFLSGDDCYFFRCSLLHQGSSQHRRSTYSRVIFVEPTATTNIFHCNVINDALNLDVRIFCRDIIQGAYRWLQSVEGMEVFRRNFDKFMRRYPTGLPPYIAGVPVIT